MSQTHYRSTMLSGIPGMEGDGRKCNDVSVNNVSPAVKQVSTITVGGATNDKEYIAQIDGIPFSFLADGSATVAEIADGLAQAILDEPLLAARVVPVSDGVDTVTITARELAQEFTLTESDAQLSVATSVANDEADEVGMGKLIISDSGGSKRGALAQESLLVAQEIVITPTAENDAFYEVDVMIEGVTYKGNFTADASATAAEIVDGLVASLNAQLPADTVLAANESDTLELTSEVAGKPFSVSIGVEGTGTAALAITSDNSNNLLTDINKAARGVTLRRGGMESNDGGLTLTYPPRSAMTVRDYGTVIVDVEESVDELMPVYAGVSSSEKGKWRGSAATGYLKLSNDKFRWVKMRGSSRATLMVDI